MPVEKTDVVDFITNNPKTKVVALVMVETRNWASNPAAIQQLHEKLDTYSQFVLTGSLAHQFPNYAKSPVSIRLEHFSPITPEVGAALRQWAGKLSGVPVGVLSHRMYWNPLISLFRRFQEKFTGPDKHLIHWPAESGDTPPLLTSIQFTNEFVTVMGGKLPNHKINVVQDMQLKVTGPDGKEIDSFLENAYTHYRAAPDNKEEIIEKYVGTVLETGKEMGEPINKDRIVPVVKNKGWLQEVNQTMHAKTKRKEIEAVHETYNDELVIAYAEDLPKIIRYLTSANLAELKLDAKDLRKLACANLERLLPVPDIKVEHGVYRIRAGGDYDASLILLESLWEHGKFDIHGEIVIAIPARDFLVATGSEDGAGLKMLKAMAEKAIVQAPYRLTSKLFVRRARRFVVFDG